MEAQGHDPYELPILKDMPELEEWLRPVWDMFHSLSSSRQYGFGAPQPIQINEILALLELRGITDLDEREEKVGLIQHMDRIFLEVKASQKPPPRK